MTSSQIGHQGTLWREFFGHLEQQVNFSTFDLQTHA